MSNNSNEPQNLGFTLLELAIVITIISLIVGGIMAGQSIMRSAELRSITIDVERYMSAVSVFEEKYESLPGDMWNATDIWDAQDAGDGLGTDCTNSASTTKTTCNGDGNGQIGNSSYEYEQFRAWHHLMNAGFIEGKYTGTKGSGGTNHSVIRENVPASDIANSGYSLLYVGTGSGDYYSASDYGHVIQFGAETSTDITDGASIVAEEAWNIDQKLDDGMPGSGNIRTYDNTALSSCADSDTAATAEYDLTQTTKGCSLIFITGF